ncbi:MAG: DHH family phosphoesterase [Faecalimonas umbilicata]|uniref:DHH family phosphoesterase n=1 Tax=Faecalimonas umbilicata TaxID=1912855 RepID=UPI003995A866
MTSTKNYKVLNDCRQMYEDEVFDVILEQRGITNPEHFFNPTEDDLLPLDSLLRIEDAFRRVDKAIKEDEKISILFDTDLDGTSSGAIITRYLKNFTSNIKTYIDEGKQHGLIGQDIEKFHDVDLLIIVDSLDKDESQYKKLHESGTDIIILDHHAIKEIIPYDKYAILVSSQRNYGNPQLSGAGVTWKFCKYMDEQYLTGYADELADLAACGLVGDMMDMTVMENRYIVSKGLSKIYNPAIKKIVGGFEFNSNAISFSVAPIINASNRIGKNDIAMKAFIEDDNKILLKYMRELKKCKELQNEEVDRILPKAINSCEKQKDNKMMVVLIDTDYGISGLLGNKLLERYQRPILILKDCGDTYKGSMRAVGVDDFRKICNESGLAKADGHELASGIEIKKELLNEFTLYIEETLSELKSDSVVDVDIQLDISDITRKMVDLIKSIDKISGANFKPIKVYINNIYDYEIGNMSDYKHLTIKPNDYLLIIKWNYNGSFDEMEDHSLVNDELKVVGTVDSGFLGRKFVLKVVCDEIEEVE